MHALSHDSRFNLISFEKHISVTINTQLCLGLTESVSLIFRNAKERERFLGVSKVITQFQSGCLLPSSVKPQHLAFQNNLDYRLQGNIEIAALHVLIRNDFIINNQYLEIKISFRAQLSCKKQQQKSTESNQFNFYNIASKKCTIVLQFHSVSFFFFFWKFFN